MKVLSRIALLLNREINSQYKDSALDTLSLGSDIVEIKTTEGLRHSFGKTVIGQAKSEYWNDVVEKCVSKDASDGLDVYVVEKEAEGTGRIMLALSMFPPKQ